MNFLNPTPGEKMKKKPVVTVQKLCVALQRHGITSPRKANKFLDEQLAALIVAALLLASVAGIVVLGSLFIRAWIKG